jgi:Arc/MetJ family transcription regulator
MSTTIDHLELEAAIVEETMRRTGKSDPRDAIIAALREFVRPRDQRDLIEYLGTSDGFYTPEELERARDTDS